MATFEVIDDDYRTTQILGESKDITNYPPGDKKYFLVRFTHSNGVTASLDQYLELEFFQCVDDDGVESEDACNATLQALADAWEEINYPS